MKQTEWIKQKKKSNLNLNLRNVLKLLHHIDIGTEYQPRMLYIHFTPNAN